jgi:hypothetical protein
VPREGEGKKKKREKGRCQRRTGTRIEWVWVREEQRNKIVGQTIRFKKRRKRREARAKNTAPEKGRVGVRERSFLGGWVGGKV